MPKKSDLYRLTMKTNVIPDGCWEFDGFRLPNGYGRIRGNDGKNWLAHRFAWMLENGPIPPGMQILHRCDNRCCVRPSHLFLGTQSENMRDMVSKGRNTPGARWRNRLSTEQVLQILARKNEPRRLVAKDYGVSAAYIGSVVSGKKYKNVPREAA